MQVHGLKVANMVASSIARRYAGKDERDRLIEGEQILTAYINGHKVSEIADRWGYAPSTVHTRLSAAIKQRIAPAADEYRAILDATLSDQMRKLEEQLDAVDKLIMLGSETRDASLIERAMTQRLRTIEARTHVVDRRAKLMGLDAPSRVEATVYVETEQDRELAQLIREAKAA